MNEKQREEYHKIMNGTSTAPRVMIRCISNKGPYYGCHGNCPNACCVLPITVNKTYESIEVFSVRSIPGNHSMYYNFVDDKGERHNYQKHSFILLDKFRQDKLEQIGI